jgi:hypothetical protein
VVGVKVSVGVTMNCLKFESWTPVAVTLWFPPVEIGTLKVQAKDPLALVVIPLQTVVELWLVMP